MFEQIEWIKSIVNMRDEDDIVIPLYVQIYGEKYSLLELDTIKKRFSPSAFKIGYGTADALFMKNSFPTNRVRDFDVVTVFTEYDDKKDRTIRYLVFESGNLDLPDSEEKDKLSEEICSYFDMLYNRVKKIVDDYFKSLIAEDHVPIIPKDPEPKKLETSDGDASLKDEETPSEDYDVFNPESDDILYAAGEDDEDPLEELRREVSEYSKDDDEPSEVSFESEEDTDYDYLSESSSVSNTESNNEEQVEDYSTDFDIF